jgi:hypothetical protein
VAIKEAAITEKSIPTIEQLSAPEFAEEEYATVEEGQLAAPDGQVLVPVILVIAYVLVQVAPCTFVCTVKTQLLTPLTDTNAVEPSPKVATTLLRPPEVTIVPEKHVQPLTLPGVEV